MTDSTQLQSLARWRLSNAHRAFWQFLFTPVLALVFAILMLRGDAEDPRKNHIESKKALLALAPPPVPDAENAALNYRKAFKAILGYAGPQEDNPESNLGREGAYFEKPAVATFLASNAAGFTLLEAATDQQLCDWKLDYSQGFLMNLSHFSSMRNCTRMLCARARFRAHAGDHAGAADDLKRANMLARHLSGDRTLLSGLVVVSIQAIVDAALQSIIIHDTPQQDVEIEAYRRAMKYNADPSDEFCRIFESETTFQAEMLDRLATLDEASSAMVSALGIPRESGTALRLIYGTERKTQLAIKQDVLKCARNGEWLLDSNDANILHRNQKGPAIFSMMTMPAFTRVQTALTREVDSRRCMDTALATLQFRAQNGRDPKSLDELIPKFLPAVPVDWFTHKPLVMKINDAEIELYSRTGVPKCNLPPGSLRIYSFGRNGKDDHGHCDWSIERINTNKMTGDDGVFFVPPIKKQ